MVKEFQAQPRMSMAMLRVARKEHVCTWCAEVVQKGDSYMRWTVIGKGWGIVTVHLACAENPYKDLNSASRIATIK
jgi:hypothetical protein